MTKLNSEFSLIVTANERKFVVLSVHAESTNWDWPDDERAAWTLATKKWQQFMLKGYDAEETFDLVSRHLVLAPNLRLPAVPHGSFVRDAYLEAEKLVWTRALTHSSTGVILTGQPGIGKTFFLWYMLVRLLQMKQVVLLHICGHQKKNKLNLRLSRC
ncbi:hypothetical protein APHAL10511_007588 [Amanita phalloides]|nr:hypothetical protein APHAL10511_007588 [Amanita phalloides]